MAKRVSCCSIPQALVWFGALKFSDDLMHKLNKGLHNFFHQANVVPRSTSEKLQLSGNLIKVDRTPNSSACDRLLCPKIAHQKCVCWGEGLTPGYEFTKKFNRISCHNLCGGKHLLKYLLLAEPKHGRTGFCQFVVSDVLMRNGDREEVEIRGCTIEAVEVRFRFTFSATRFVSELRELDSVFERRNPLSRV